MPRFFPRNGFTLVELAIVLMIIGLLIGGVLKGQEMVTNARITSAMRQLKSYDAATITFQDSYAALPGDILNPSTRLPNCSAARCNTSGNGNGNVGVLNTPADTENNTYWLHLAAANLITGMDMDSTWTSANYHRFDFPRTSLEDSSVVLGAYNKTPTTPLWPIGLYGHQYSLLSYASSSTPINKVTLPILERIDTKYDDGKPKEGDIRLTACEPVMHDYAVLDPATLCRFVIKAGF